MTTADDGRGQREGDRNDVACRSCPRSRTRATTALISSAPSGATGRCNCVGVSDLRGVMHHLLRTHPRRSRQFAPLQPQRTSNMNALPRAPPPRAPPPPALQAPPPHAGSPLEPQAQPLLGATTATGRRTDNASKMRTRAATDDGNCQSRGRGFKSRRARHWQIGLKPITTWL
jgi:hypothetical protein